PGRARPLLHRELVGAVRPLHPGEDAVGAGQDRERLLMTAVPIHLSAPHAPRLQSSVEALRGALLWLTGLFGAFVFMEPSLYELASLLAMVVFVASSLTLTTALMPLAAFLALYNIGFALAVIPALDQPKTALWVLVSCYLCTTALFFAAALGRNTQARL